MGRSLPQSPIHAPPIHKRALTCPLSGLELLSLHQHRKHLERLLPLPPPGLPPPRGRSAWLLGRQKGRVRQTGAGSAGVAAGLLDVMRSMLLSLESSVTLGQLSRPVLQQAACRSNVITSRAKSHPNRPPERLSIDSDLPFRVRVRDRANNTPGIEPL